MLTSRNGGGTLGKFKVAVRQANGTYVQTAIDNQILPPFYKNDEATADPATVKSYLKRELKIDLNNHKETSLIQALTKPEDWLKERKIKLDEIADTVEPTFTTALKVYVDSGYPYDEAQALATQEANAVYQIKMQQLNAIMPGAGVLLTGAVKEREYQGTKASMYNGGDSVDYKAKYEKRKAKKATRKAKHLALENK